MRLSIFRSEYCATLSGRLEVKMANQRKAEHGSWIAETCTKTDLSILLGLSVRTLTDMAATGVLVPGAKKGTYQTTASVQNYVKRLREVAAARSEEQRNPLNEEKLQTERVIRQLKEIELAERRGDMLSLDEVSENWTAFARKVKAAFLGLPTKIRQKLPHVSTADGEIIRKTVRRVLQDLAKEVDASVIAGDPKDVKDN